MAAIAVLFLTLAPRITREMPDFDVYRRAGARALKAEPLYRAQDGHYQFKYLPAFAIAGLPLAAIPATVAKQLWFVLSLALVFLVLGLSIGLLERQRRPPWLLMLVMLITMAKFYGHELILGQVNLLFLAIVLGALVALQRDRDGLAAALLVAAVVVKPYAVIFLPWLALTRGRAAAASVVLALVFVAGLPVARYGMEGTVALHKSWWQTVTTTTAPNLTNPDNVSVAGFAAKWLGENGTLLALGLAGALVGVTVVVVFLGRGLRGRETLEGALLLTLIPLLSPQGWDYVFLIATPAVAMIANYDDYLPVALRAASWLALGAIGLSLYDVLGRDLYATFMQMSVITVCFFVVVAALGALRLRRVL